VHTQDGPSRRAPEKGSGDRKGKPDVESAEGGKGDARPAAQDRRAEDAGLERQRYPGRDEDGGGDRAVDGARGGGLMRTHGKHYRAAVGTLEPRKLYPPRDAAE